MSPDPLCYFGCSGRLNRTLLDLPDHPTPKLCEHHSEQWGIYKAALIAQTSTVDWPADFWPFERKMRAEMEKEAQLQGDTLAAQACETRAPGTEIMASEAIGGSWYEVPSGEIERCVGSRHRGRGVQVGFAGILDAGKDPDEIRWLQGKTSIIVADEIEDAAMLVRSLREDGKGKAPDMPFEICPRNGLLCSVCGFQQRERPNGATCENGHGGAPGEGREAQANALAEQGYVEEARILLESHPDDSEPQAGGPGMTLREIAESFPQHSDLAGLAAREAGELVAEKSYTTPVYHKSLHIDWRTPRPLFDSQVRRWGPFWLDAAATAENKLAEYHLGPGAEVEDALSVDWLPTPEIVAAYGENAWLNHPYSKRESVCIPGCAKPKCAERGYHLERPIASSGEWMAYARDQVLLRGAPRVVCLTKAAVETGWWKEAVRIQPPEAGKFISGLSDPTGGPAAPFMDPQYPAATWIEFTWERLIVDIVEIEGRVDFDRGGDDGSAGFPSAIVTFSRRG